MKLRYKDIEVEGEPKELLKFFLEIWVLLNKE